jgi:hypothetical protein
MRRYSPAKCIGADMKTLSGNPDPQHVSSSYLERTFDDARKWLCGREIRMVGAIGFEPMTSTV